MTHPAPDRPRNRATDARPRRTRPARLTWAQVRAQWPLALVLVGVAVALGFVILERWRRGAFLLGVVALAAAVLRAVVPDERARLLGVRGRGFDVAFYAGLGVVILWLATSIDSLGTG
ncbi:DUF3017 domain-containing protein [Dietzia sp. ANT_WB102]|uniref:DUF3017 domain-containing protein n=1 Tax=Dietzia sp. ANT_WB102 TaxID=2597345 RepID=UPI0011EBACF0|nr:DUF3017 domain-containing protein [Dietzia sp. ANT_WB102]KAA0916973.1 DUF3017 domain-containing protein [Dietzia sp. ANT_WB102]